MSGPDRQPTLLEDLESLQRNLKELESVKSYVQVIHRALYLRCEKINRFRTSPAYALSETLQRSCHPTSTGILFTRFRLRLWSLACIRFAARRKVHHR